MDRLRLEATFRTEGCIEQLIAQLRLGPPRRRALEPGGGWIPATRQVIMPDPYGWMVKGVGSGGLPY